MHTNMYIKELVYIYEYTHIHTYIGICTFLVTRTRDILCYKKIDIRNDYNYV